MPSKIELQEALDAALADIEIIHTKLAAEAEKRSWCSDYSTFITEVNTETSVPRLGSGRMSYWLDGTVTLSISGRVEVPTTDGARPTRTEAAEAFKAWLEGESEIMRPHVVDAINRVTVRAITEPQSV